MGYYDIRSGRALISPAQLLFQTRKRSGDVKRWTTVPKLERQGKDWARIEMRDNETQTDSQSRVFCLQVPGESFREVQKTCKSHHLKKLRLYPVVEVPTSDKVEGERRGETKDLTEQRQSTSLVLRHPTVQRSHWATVGGLCSPPGWGLNFSFPAACARLLKF